MSPFGIFLTLLFCSGVIGLSPRYAALAYFGSVLYITQGQSVDIAGINFVAIRFVEVAVLLRVIAKKELSVHRCSTTGRWLVLFFVVFEILLISRTGEMDMYGFGNAIDGCIAYFTFRALLSNPEDLIAFLKGSVALLFPLSLCMMVESATGRNLFSLMGGVPEVSVFRDGHFRAQAGFRHSIAAGSLGATFFPLFVSCLLISKMRLWAVLGLVSSVLIVVASRSSGPFLTMVTVICAWACWLLRNKMAIVRRGIATFLIALHLMMKQPVWFIFDRISGIIGGDGWHRSNLIDKFILHFDKWWWMGMAIEDTGDWAATKMPWGGVDVTNNYVSVGLGGGFLSLVIFIVLISSCFSHLGRALHFVRQQIAGQDSRNLEVLLWGLGSAVCGHIVNMTAVVYWDQFATVWYLHLAIAGSIARYALNQPLAAQRQELQIKEELPFSLPGKIAGT